MPLDRAPDRAVVHASSSRAIQGHLQELPWGFWGGFMGCSGLPATSSDGFGPWLVAGSLYSAPQHQAAHGMQMSVDTVSPSLRGYRCVHICCWPTFKILNLARERGLWSYSCIWSYSEHRGEEAPADSCSCRHRSLPSCCSHRCVTISCKLRDKLRVDVL